jgi:WS/DGAT/MGAT family acyltransferase
MRQLSAMDAQFLHLETPTTVAHVGSLIVVDREGGALTLDGLRDVIEPRLHLTPVLRQRLAFLSVSLGPMYWVDDPDFDIEFHLREVGLPAPGDDVQLGEQVARIHARPLDRSHPLWEMYLIDNLAGGRQAVYSKVHHAAVDGVSGAEILATLMDASPEAPDMEPADDEWQPAAMPGPAALLAAGLDEILLKPVTSVTGLVRALPYLRTVPGVADVPALRALTRVVGSFARMGGGSAQDKTSTGHPLTVPRTPLNGAITAHRRFAFGSVDLDDVKSVKNAHGMTLNDVVMALCAGALRRWLLDHDGLPAEPLVAAVPVSVRSTGQDGDAANQVSVMLAELPTHLPQPAERLAFVGTAMTEAKGQFEDVPATILQDIATVIPTAFAGLASRAAYRMGVAGRLPFNLFISNVPGPQLPLYVAGARVQGIYPASAISDVSGALNITLFSYDGSLDFGLIACRELVPDVWRIIGYLHDEVSALLELS